jgi:phage-related minor tail protein
VTSIIDVVVRVAEQGAGEAAGAVNQLGAAFGPLGSLISGAITPGAIGLATLGSAAVAAGVGAFKVGEDFSMAGDKIRVGTGATGAALDGLKEQFDHVVSDVPASFDDASSAITSLHQKLDLTGPPLEALSEQELNLARITGGDLSANISSSAQLFNNWGVAAGDQGHVMDYLFRTTQATGVGFNDLASNVADNGVKMRALGFSLEDTTALFGGLEKAGVNVTAIMPGFSKELANSMKSGKDAKAVLQDMFDEIQRAPDATKTGQDAMALFGAKAGPQLVNAIKEGKLSFKDLESTIAGGSDTINKAAGDTQHLGERWTLFTNNVKVAIQPAASAVFDFVDNLGTKLMPVFAQVEDRGKVAFGWLKENVGPILSSLSTAVQPAVDALGRFWDKIEGTKSVMIALGIVLGGVVLAAIWSLVGALGAMAVAVVAATWPFLLIVAVLAAVVAAVLYAWNHWEGFRTAVQNVVNWLVANVPPIFERIRSAIATAFDWIVNVAVPAITNAFNSFMGFLQNTLLPAIMTVWDGISRGLQMAWAVAGPIISFIVGFISDNFGHIQAIVSNVWDEIRNIIANAWQIISNIIQLALNIISGNWGAAWDNIKNILSAVWDTIQNLVSNGLGIIREILETALAFIGDLGGRMFEGIVNGAKAMIDHVSGVLGGLWDTVTGALSGAVSWLFDAGRNIIQGLIDGIKNAAGAVKDAVGNVLSGARNLLPFSPAKEGPLSGMNHTLYSGQALAGDFARGIISYTPQVRGAVSDMAAAAQIPSSAGGAGGGGVVTNHYWTVQGSIRSDRDLIRMVRDELVNGGFGRHTQFADHWNRQGA